MDNDTGYPAPLQAVIDWVNEGSGNWEYVPDGRHIDFSFRCEGYEYTATAIEENGEELTISLVYEMPKHIDELALRRRISDVDIGQKYGALIYNHEIGVIVWRDTISSDNADDFGSSAVDEVLACGIRSFNALRIALADLLGSTAADVQLATTYTAGRA